MSATQIIGVVLLVIGAVLLFFGMQQADSPVDQVTEAVTGRYTDETMWYLIGGLALIVGGGLMALFGRRG
ncbi:DUF3185 family protein [Ectothiorhodospiraceae bacterium 2226]|nr:DUF3185 family protein [Ectothiorhodospiraceae bacterium 2226]